MQKLNINIINPLLLQSVYEKLGHAEVVQVSVSGNPGSNPQAAQEFRSFADTYFKQFR
jgi:hypothetical protein